MNAEVDRIMLDKGKDEAISALSQRITEMQDEYKEAMICICDIEEEVDELEAQLEKAEASQKDWLKLSAAMAEDLANHKAQLKRRDELIEAVLKPFSNVLWHHDGETHMDGMCRAIIELAANQEGE